MNLLSWLFGCRHRNYSFPQTVACGRRKKLTYVVCLGCGKEYEYDWERMRRLQEIKVKQPARPHPRRALVIELARMKSNNVVRFR